MHLGRLAVLAGLAGSSLLFAPHASAADSDDDSRDHSSDSSDKSDSDKSDKPEKGDKDEAEKAEVEHPEALIPRGPRTPEQQELDRYTYLNAELTKVQASTERWFAGWTCGFAAVALSQYSLAVSAPNTGLREVSIVGAINATLGFGAMLISPNTLLGSREKLDNYDTTMPQGIYERRRRAEYYLRATTAEEKYWHGPIPIVLAAVTSGIGGGVLWGVYKQELGGIATFAAGIALTALQMISRPSSAQAAWKRYQNRYHPVTPTVVPPDQVDLFLSRLNFAPTPMGGSIGMTF